MRVHDVMTKTVTTIPETAAAEVAFERMQAMRIGHLVVTSGSRIAGILSERDLGPEPAGRRGRTVAELMTPHAVEATPDMPLRKAANLMRGRTISCLPVVDDGKLVGIVTVSDLLTLVGKGLGGPSGNRQRTILKARAPRVKPLIARQRS